MDNILLSFSACALMGISSSVSAEENAVGGVPLVVESFFDGKLDAHGVILTRGGKVRRSFNAVMQGAWEEKEGTLHGVLTEDFAFDDGEKLLRRWEFIKTATGSYSGTASDVDGVASLAASGNALRMDYDLKVPVSGKSIILNVEDWLWLMEPEVLVNKSTMRKWGFRVGEIVTTILKK